MIRDTRRWIRGYQSRRTIKARARMLKFLGVFRQEQAAWSDCKQPWVQNRQDYQILGPWQKLKAFSYILFAIYKATISTWLLRILNKGGEERPSIWSPWTGSLRTQSSLNYNSTVNFRWAICKNSLWVSRASQMLTSRRTSKRVNLTLRRWHKVHLFIQNVAHR